MVVTPAFLAKATQKGLRTREYRVAPGGRIDCTVTAEDDLLVARLVGDFKGLSRLDVVAEQEGLPVRRIEDVPISPDATELIVAQAMPYMRTVQHARLRIRLLSQEAGGERLLGEYTFDHRGVAPLAGLAVRQLEPASPRSVRAALCVASSTGTRTKQGTGTLTRLGQRLYSFFGEWGGAGHPHGGEGARRCPSLIARDSAAVP
jgi:hypothetical protein